LSIGNQKRYWFRPCATAVTTVVAVATILWIGNGFGQTPTDPTGADLARLTALEAELTSLETEIQRLEDIKAIQRLQRAYGYYADKKLADQIGVLFADDATVEIGGYGVYVGRERITEFYDWLMGGPLREGQLYNHIIMQGVVTVEPGATTGRGRWRALIQTGEHGESAIWSEGPYENEYVRDDGVWKFSKVHWYQTVAAPYDPGWHQDPLPMPGPSDELPPDRPPTETYESYPGAYLPPYHYPNPVTGRPTAVTDD
jgi:hypothetical protein